MANSDKNILITPNIGAGTGTYPEISFVGSGNTPIRMRVLDNNAVEFKGASGQLFSINNTTTGTIFSVNDVSGVPSINVDAGGRVDLARYNGQVQIGQNANTTDKDLCVTGAIALTNKKNQTTPASIHFYEDASNTGTGNMYMGYDGPNKGDNENYWFVRNSSNTCLLYTSPSPRD